MTDEINAAWRKIDDMLGDAIQDHPTRIAIIRKILDVRTAERVHFSAKLEDCERRISVALLGAGEETRG